MGPPRVLRGLAKFRDFIAKENKSWQPAITPCHCYRKPPFDGDALEAGLRRAVLPHGRVGGPTCSGTVRAREEQIVYSAATRRTELDLARLTRLLDRAVEAPDPLASLALHNECHIALRGAAPQPHDHRAYRPARHTTARLRCERDAGAIESEPHRGEHREILAAVRAGDAERARVLMIEHQSRTRDLRIAAMAHID